MFTTKSNFSDVSADKNASKVSTSLVLRNHPNEEPVGTERAVYRDMHRELRSLQQSNLDLITILSQYQITLVDCEATLAALEDRVALLTRTLRTLQHSPRLAPVSGSQPSDQASLPMLIYRT